MTTEEPKLVPYSFVDGKPEGEVQIELIEDADHRFEWAGGPLHRELYTWVGRGFKRWIPARAAQELMAGHPSRFREVGRREAQLTNGRWQMEGDR